MKKTISFIFIILVLILIFYMTKNKDNSILFENKNLYSINTNYEKIQNMVDKEIEKFTKDKKNTLSSPKTILNPYGNSPLTSLVIFNTKENISIKLYVNDVFMTTMEKSKKHLIPIYGLRENYNNKIKLIDDNNNEKEIYIKTEKLDNSNFYEYKTNNISNKFLFLNMPSGKYAIDNEGYISWYLNTNKLDFDMTEDGKIYYLDNINRLIEMDYMGRVNKSYYIDSDSYNHRMEKIDENYFMIIDSANRLSLIDYKTGKIIKKLSVYDIFKNIDSNFNAKNEMFYVNHFQYNSLNNTLLISIRGLDAVLNYDLENEKIIWIFSNSKLLSNKFDKYKLKLLNGGYFSGQHTPHLIGNKLYIFDNNNYVLGNIEKNKLNKSSAVIYEIYDKNIKEIYRYNSNYKSIWYGSFYETDNIKNINFGNIFNNSNSTYSKVIELDKKDNIITEFISKESDRLIYESYRQTFYQEITSNYQTNYKLENIIVNENYANLKDLKLHRSNNRFKKNIKNSIVEETVIEFKDNKLEFNIMENLEVLFIDKNYKYYKVNIDYSINDKDSLEIYVNTLISQLNGKYAIYFKINEKFYNTNIVLESVMR